MGTVTDAIEAAREGKILELLRATRRANTKRPASEATIAAAMQATADKAIIELIQETSARRAAVRPAADPAHIQRGRNLYNQLNQKGN